ncbi:hypothetical protein M0Q50_09140 [bacterium]|jgi:hypothetical protein|nr:hypothetical protein [bacterium]
MGRKKKSDDRKKKKISTTIYDDLWISFEEYSQSVGINKSRLLENMIKDGLIDPEVLIKLKELGILLPNSKLI